MSFTERLEVIIVDNQEYYEKVRDIVAKFFLVEKSSLNKDTRIEADLGGKSIIVMQIMNAIEDEYDVSLNYMQFRRAETIGKMADYVAEECNK
jgi:acyl carrier protein